MVVFAQTGRPPVALQELASIVRPPDRFAIGEHAAYLHCPNGILASPAAERALAGLGEVITTRNWATVLKLLALAVPHGVHEPNDRNSQ